MKNIFLLCTCALFLSGATLSAKAAEKDGHDKNDKKSENQLTLDQQINAYVAYPDFAKQENIEGTVRASYIIDENGQIAIKEIFCKNARLKEYVYAQLNGKKVVTYGLNSSEIKYLKFKFQLI